MKSDDYFGNHDINFGTWREKVFTYFQKRFDVETECYERIVSAESSVRVPKMYDHGEIITRKDGQLFSFGWGIILEYLE